MTDSLDVKPFVEIKQKVEDVIDNYINKKFKGRPYDAKQAQNWANNSSEEIIKHVQEQIGQDYKFMCSLIILEMGTSGFHMSASCFWDSKNDGNFSKKYPFTDYYVIINVFGFARI